MVVRGYLAHFRSIAETVRARRQAQALQAMRERAIRKQGVHWLADGDADGFALQVLATGHTTPAPLISD